MKLLLLMALLFTGTAHAANPLLVCLGAEEKRLHQNKNTGPIYDLNQRITSEMIQIPAVAVSPEDFKAICKKAPYSESWKLLELSLRKGKSLFVIPASVTGLQRAITEGMIDDYVIESKDIFLTFISHVQTISPTPDCLLQEIPQLNNFFTEIKYLQEDIDMKKIMAGKDTKIFDQIKDYPAAFQRCRDRLKKNASPGSEASDKKP
jgi:hypothetical protein